MLVLIDMKWVSDAETPCYPTQISAIRVDEKWSSVDRFDNLIKPSDPSDKNLSKAAYKGFPPADFLAANSAIDVFSCLYDWFRMDDVLCWWNTETVSAFKQATHCLLRQVVGHDMKILEPVCAKASRKPSGANSLYAAARSHGVTVPQGILSSRQDVEIMYSLLKATRTTWKSILSAKSYFDTTDELEDSLSDEEPSYAHLYPIYVDKDTQIVHKSSCDKIRDAQNLRSIESYKTAIKSLLPPCSCCREDYWDENREINDEIIRRCKFAFVYAKDGVLFHRPSCINVRRIRYMDLRGAVNYDRCVEHNMKPCGWCKPQKVQSLGCAMLTDVEYGASRFTKTDGDFLYFPVLDRDGCKLKRIGLDGVIDTVVSTDGILSDYDVHEDNIFFTGMLNMKLPELYRVEKDGNCCLTTWNEEALKDTYVAKPQPIMAELDGEEIDGWVLLPEEYDPEKKYPAVLDIHGGPKCAYGPVFFHEMQAWAAKGYIVFFCNPHGSDGRGNAFSYLDLQWGSIDYRQIMAFTDKVLETYPAIDVKRVCCTGGSYGGYMSNWILGHTDRFCCVATQRSISNWVSMYGISDIPPISNFEVCSDDPYSEKGFAEMWAVSPLKYVRNAKTPTLIIHSEEDHRCPIAEGYQLYTALVYLRVPARMVVFHGENHELSRTGKPAHRLRRLEEITGWFDKYAK